MKSLGSNQKFKTNRLRAFRQGSELMSEINVTPFVDVMLVLLIIFMITAPMLTVGIEIDIPETSAKSVTGADSEQVPFELYVDSSGKLFINQTPLDDKQLMRKLELIANQRKDKVLYVKADGRNSYGRISKILGELDNASFLKKYILVHLPNSGKAEEF